MKAVRRVEGRVAVLDRVDVDTDQIMPKQFLKRVERTGYGEFAFFDWRSDPTFTLLRPPFAASRAASRSSTAPTSTRTRSCRSSS